jgi:hypothetical protein
MIPQAPPSVSLESPEIGLDLNRRALRDATIGSWGRPQCGGRNRAVLRGPSIAAIDGVLVSLKPISSATSGSRATPGEIKDGFRVH